MTLYLERPGGRISYDDSGGDGPLVVAAPGMGDLRQVYRLLAAELVGAGYRFVSMDLRGMGESTIDWQDYSDEAIGADLVALIDELGSGPAIVVGNSLTAASAVLAATTRPDAIAALVLMGPFVRDVPTSWFQKLAFRALLLPPWGRSAWVSYYRKQMYPLAPPTDHDEYVSALADNLGEPGRFKAFHSLAFNSHAAAEARLDDVSVPVLIVMGTADPDFPEPTEEARYLSERLAAELHLVEGAGHYPQAEAPETVAAAIRAFVSDRDVA